MMVVWLEKKSRGGFCCESTGEVRGELPGDVGGRTRHIGDVHVNGVEPLYNGGLEGGF